MDCTCHTKSKPSTTCAGLCIRLRRASVVAAAVAAAVAVAVAADVAAVAAVLLLSERTSGVSLVIFSSDRSSYSVNVLLSYLIFVIFFTLARFEG